MEQIKRSAGQLQSSSCQFVTFGLDFTSLIDFKVCP